LRMISFKGQVHKSNSNLALSMVLLMLILTIGCSGDDNSADEGQTKNNSSSMPGLKVTKQECSTIILTGGWEMFCDYGNQALAGKDLSIGELESSEMNQLWLFG